MSLAEIGAMTATLWPIFTFCSLGILGFGRPHHEHTRIVAEGLRAP